MSIFEIDLHPAAKGIFSFPFQLFEKQSDLGRMVPKSSIHHQILSLLCMQMRRLLFLDDRYKNVYEILVKEQLFNYVLEFPGTSFT